MWCKLILFLVVVSPFPLLLLLSTSLSWLGAFLDDRLGSSLPSSYDYIVVGAGSAGSVVAGRLAGEGHSVLLVDAGGPAPSLAHIPALVDLLQNTPLDWAYRTEVSSGSSLGMNGVSHLPRGKVLGGSSILNYLVYLRGNSRDYTEWEELGCEGWSWENVLPYFLKSEDVHGSNWNRETHGQGGELKVETAGYKEPIIHTFLKAGEQLGYNIGDTNGEMEDQGFSEIHRTQYNGLRAGTYKAFAEKHVGKNLTVLTYAQVTRVLVESGRAVGVEAVRFGKNLTFHAEREVVVSAGAVGTPQLLMLSGIGDTEHLTQVGIVPEIHLPGVGQNLQDHLCITIPMDVDPEFSLDLTSAFLPPSWLSLAQGDGPLTSTGLDGMAFLRSSLQDPLDPRPDIQLHMLSLTFASDYGIGLHKNGGFDDKLLEWYEPHYGKEGGLIIVNQARPRSRGYIKLRSSDPFIHPIIQPNYLEDQHDVDTLVAGLKIALNLSQTEAFQSAGAKLWGPVPLCSHLQFQSDPYWECYVRHLAGTVYHPVGTAAMGSVLDSRLRVLGLQGLRVADGSVMPRLVGANTNAAIIMIGEKAADMIIEDWGRVGKYKVMNTEQGREEL